MLRQLATVVALFVTGLGFASCERNLPVSVADQDVILRAADLIPFGYRAEQTEQYEYFKRVRNFDGSHELEYEYATPATEHEHVLHMNVTASVEKAESDAQNLQSAKEIGITIGLKASGVTQREIENFYHYGDEAHFRILEKDSHAIGNVFIVREGKRLYVLIMSGIYFEDAATFKELIEGRLKKFSAYSPT